MVRAGFPINRTITAKELFIIVDKDDYVSIPSSQRLGIAHEPILETNIMATSPLHSYTCVFRWHMLLIYHLNAGKFMTAFPWANITPSLHKLLAHCIELIRDCDEAYGLKKIIPKKEVKLVID